MNANDLRPGMVIQHNGELFSIHKAEHRTPGNLRAFVQARMRNQRTGALIDHRFRSEDTVEKANLADWIMFPSSRSGRLTSQREGRLSQWTS